MSEKSPERGFFISYEQYKRITAPLACDRDLLFS